MRCVAMQRDRMLPRVATWPHLKRQRRTSEPVGARAMADGATGERNMDTAVLDALLGSLPQGFVLLDLETRIVRLSTSFATRFAATTTELVGKPLGDVLPALAQVVADARERVLARGESLNDVALSGIGGATRWSSN